MSFSDSAARLMALTRVVAAVEASDTQTVAQLVGAGISPALLERLRSMSLGDAVRFAGAECGLSLAIDARVMTAQISRLDRAKSDRETMEYLVRNGASPRLLTQLFALTQTDARRMRQTLAPEIAAGGRPRQPTVDQREEIEIVWAQIKAQQSCPRARIRELHQRFPDLPIASLELVILPQTVLQPLE